MADPNDEAPSLPLFYKSLRPVNVEQDASKRIRRGDYRFAASVNAIPLILPEIPSAAGSYPIVFTDNETPVPVAVVGLKTDVNLFVDEVGKWRSLTHIPTYVQRYPFFGLRSNGSLILGFDEASDLVNDSDGEPLVEDGGSSNFASAALELCAALARTEELTEAFVAQLLRFDLFETQAFQIRFSDGAAVRLGGLKTVSSEKFNSLPDSVLIEWERRGISALVHAILFSSGRWENLAALYGEREGATPVGTAQAVTGRGSSTSPREGTAKPQSLRVESASHSGFRLSKPPGFGAQF